MQALSASKSFFKEVGSKALQDVKRAFEKKDLNYLILILFWSVGSITLISLIVLIIASDEKDKYISAFAILLSAFMASVAVMRSISMQVKHEREKSKRDLLVVRENLFQELMKFTTHNMNVQITDDFKQPPINLKKYKYLFDDRLYLHAETLFKKAMETMELKMQIAVLRDEVDPNSLLNFTSDELRAKKAELRGLHSKLIEKNQWFFHSITKTNELMEDYFNLDI